MNQNYTTVSVKYIKAALSAANHMKTNNDTMFYEICKIVNIKAQELFNESVKNIKNKIEEYNKFNWLVKLIKHNPKDYYGYEENMDWKILDYDIKRNLFVQYEKIYFYPDLHYNSFPTYTHTKSIRNAIDSLKPEIKKLFDYYHYTDIDADLVRSLECLVNTDLDTVYLNDATMQKLSHSKWWKAECVNDAGDEMK